MFGPSRERAEAIRRSVEEVTRSFRLVVAALPLIATIGCQVVGELGAVNSLRTGLAAEFGEPDLTVSIHSGRFLSVSLVNSPKKALPREEKEKKALEIAHSAYAKYPSREKLETVRVLFVVRRSLLVFRYTNASDGFKYNVSELRAQDAPELAAPSPAPAPVVR